MSSETTIIESLATDQDLEVKSQLSKDRRTVIEIQKEYLHFSAAHFTIFSATVRENLHGHNFHVEAALSGPIREDGLCFDYNDVKRKIKALCDSLDEKTLLPRHSPHLSIVEDGPYLVAHFHDEKIPFLPRDVITLPVRNVTVEELAYWFAEALLADAEFGALPIDELTIRVSSGPGQWASARWSRS